MSSGVDGKALEDLQLPLWNVAPATRTWDPQVLHLYRDQHEVAQSILGTMFPELSAAHSAAALFLGRTHGPDQTSQFVTMSTPMLKLVTQLPGCMACAGKSPETHSISDRVQFLWDHVYGARVCAHCAVSRSALTVVPS